MTGWMFLTGLWCCLVAVVLVLFCGCFVDVFVVVVGVVVDIGAQAVVAVVLLWLLFCC